jgi:hypothetical protein
VVSPTNVKCSGISAPPKNRTPLEDTRARVVGRAVKTSAGSWSRRQRTPLRFVRFSPAALRTGVKPHLIEGVTVRVTEPARTIIDLFRYRRRVGQTVAVDGLKEALRRRRVTPSEIARLARDFKIARLLAPYLEALTADG